MGSDPEYDFYKVGGILLDDRKILVCRTKGKDVFVAPGGKMETGETPVQTLVRELAEELAIAATEDDLELFGTFYAKAAADDNHTLRMDVYTVLRWKGVPRPSREVEEISWIDSRPQDKIKIGSVIEHEVIPRLKTKGFIN